MQLQRAVLCVLHITVGPQDGGALSGRTMEANLSVTILPHLNTGFVNTSNCDPVNARVPAVCKCCVQW